MPMSLEVLLTSPFGSSRNVEKQKETGNLETSPPTLLLHAFIAIFQLV